MKNFLIGMAGALIVVLLALGIIYQVSMHKRIARAEVNIQNIGSWATRQQAPQPIQQPVQPKAKKK